MAQVYAPEIPKSPSAGIAPLPSVLRGFLGSSLPRQGEGQGGGRSELGAALDLDQTHPGGRDHCLQLGMHRQLLDHVVDVPLHGVGGDAQA
jgi:hypothetical protein